MNPKMGGPSQGLRNIIPEMTKHGFINEVVCLDDPENSFVANQPFKVHALGSVSNKWSYSKILKRWLKEHITNYDSVIVHGLWLYPSFAVSNEIIRLRQECQRLAPTFFIMPHGMLDPWFQTAASRKKKAIRNLLYWAMIERKVIATADAVLFTCKRELELAATTFPAYRPRNTIDIGYGIASPPPLSVVLHERDLFTQFDSFRYILFLGRIDQKKGLDLLLRAYSKILLERPDVPFLVIAGPVADGQFFASLSEIIDSSAALMSRVMFAGMLTGIEKWAAIYCCDALILPSHQENFAISVVEAMACRKPVIISDQVNINTEVHDSKAGIVNSDTLEGIISGLREFLAMDENERDIMGRRAYELYQRSYRIENTAVALSNLLTSTSYHG